MMTFMDLCTDTSGRDVLFIQIAIDTCHAMQCCSLHADVVREAEAMSYCDYSNQDTHGFIYTFVLHYAEKSTH